MLALVLITHSGILSQTNNYSGKSCTLESSFTGHLISSFQGLSGIAAIIARLIVQCLFFQEEEEEASYQFHNLETLCSQMKSSRYMKSEV